MTPDHFRPHTEPARTFYDVFQAEATKRPGRGTVEWMAAEMQVVWSAARDYAQQNGLRVLTLDEIERAEQYASGSVDYGAKWAYRIRDMFIKQETTDEH